MSSASLLGAFAQTCKLARIHTITFILSHVLMYIQMSNLKRCVEYKCKKICGKTADLCSSVVVVALSFRRFTKVYEKHRPYLTVRVPAITLTCPITTMLFRSCLYAVVLLQERLRSNRIQVKRRRYLTCLPDFRSGTARRQLHAKCGCVSLAY